MKVCGLSGERVLHVWNIRRWEMILKTEWGHIMEAINAKKSEFKPVGNGKSHYSRMKQ